MKKRFLLLILPISAIILELIPGGVIMRFATPPGEPPVFEYCSYFSLLPFGYGNIMPLLTALITCAVFIMLLVYCVKESDFLLNCSRGFLCGGIFFSVLSYTLFGSENITLIGVSITALLAAELLVLLFVKKRKP